jgi:hypothetical protein
LINFAAALREAHFDLGKPSLGAGYRIFDR